MTVFTYFDPGVPIAADQTGLVREWAASWSRWGWKPRVLTPVMAFQHPGACEYLERVSRLPTTNPRAYENACYMRWLALERAGGGWLTDYDVINRGFKPRKGCRRVEMLDSTYVPCVVWASKTGAPEITSMLCTYNPPRALTHVSDMLIFKSQFDQKEFGPPGNECVEFRSPGWEQAPLVHFSTGKCANFPDKLTAIRSAACA